MKKKIANYEKYLDLITSSINSTDGIVKNISINIQNYKSNKIEIKLNNDNQLCIKCYVNIYYGYVLNDVVCELQENIFKKINSITNIQISNIDVSVINIIYNI